MSVFYPVCAGEPDEGSGKFTIFAVFVREFCRIKILADSQIDGAVIAPFKPGVSPGYVQAEIDRDVVYGDPCIQELVLLPVLQMDNGQRALP